MTENQSLQNFDWDAYELEKQGKQNEETKQKYDQTLWMPWIILYIVHLTAILVPSASLGI
jgi:hypothetical protein